MAGVITAIQIVQPPPGEHRNSIRRFARHGRRGPGTGSHSSGDGRRAAAFRSRERSHVSNAARPPEQERTPLLHHPASHHFRRRLALSRSSARAPGLVQAFTKNESPALADLPIQYPDYAAWQRSSIKEISPDHLSYWQGVCSDLPVLDLPTDHPRPAAQTYAGAMETFQVSAPTAAALRMLSHEKGATPFMTMTAAFMALLHGYTGQEDIAVGGVSSGRHHRETHESPRLFPEHGRHSLRVLEESSLYRAPHARPQRHLGSVGA